MEIGPMNNHALHALIITALVLVLFFVALERWSI